MTAKILTVDIETSPNVAYVWGLWDQNVSLSQLIKPTEMLSFAAKWLDEKKIMFFSKQDGHETMVKEAHSLMDEADVIIGYNSKKFDVKHMNRELLKYQLPQPSPFGQIDLLLEVRKKFAFPSNKLDYVSQVCGKEPKVTHEGFKLWEEVMNNDEKAWKIFEKYNKHDVKITEESYLHLRDLGWINGGVNLGGFSESDHACPSCGSDNQQKRGPYRTKAGTTRQRYQCQDCFTWSSGEILAELPRQILKAVSY